MANDGLMALEHWEHEKPDCIILDLNLPKLNGLQVLQSEFELESRYPCRDPKRS